MFKINYGVLTTINNKWRLLLILFLTSLLAFPASAERVFRIGMESSYPPFAYKNDKGEFAGFDYDISEAICKLLKAKCEWVEYNFDDLIPDVRAGKIDMAISSISITNERKQVVNFSNKYYFSAAKLMVSKDLEVSENLAELKGKKIGVINDTTSYRYAKEFFAKQGIRVINYETQLEIFMDLITGKLQGTLGDAIPLEIYFLTKSYGEDFHFVGEPLDDPKYFGEGIGIAVKKGNTALVNELNNAIQTLRKDGTYQKIQSKYFENDIYGD